MYTRCPSCETIFAVAKDQINDQEGVLTCATCEHSFNALNQLADDVHALMSNSDDADVADAANSSAQSENEATSPSAADAESIASASLEFDAPEQTWSEFFVEPSDENGRDQKAFNSETDDVNVWQGLLDEIDSPVEDDDPTSDLPHLSTAGKLSEQNEIVGIDSSKIQSESFETTGAQWVFEDDGEASGTDSSEHAWGRDELQQLQTPSFDDSDQEEVPFSAAFQDYAEDSNEEDAFSSNSSDFRENSGPAGSSTTSLPPWLQMDDDDEPEVATAAAVGRSTWPAATAAILFVLLVIQFVHYNRDSLAAGPTAGGTIRQLYGAFESPLYPDWKLSAFEISGSEAVAGRSNSGALDILANMRVSGDHNVGLPLVRVVLRDRWSSPIAGRVFRPVEYLRTEDQAPTLVAPGTTLPIEISVADPGATALGYVVDICLPRRAEGLECQIEIDPFR